MESALEFRKKLQKEVQGLQNRLSKPIIIELKYFPYYFYAKVEDGGRLAVQTLELGIKKELDGAINEKQFKILLTSIPQRVSYLSEKITLVEQDRTTCSAQFRSENPQSIDESIEYFEVSIEPDAKITLYRILRKDHKKTTVPFVINYDIVERFFHDTVEIMDAM